MHMACAGHRVGLLCEVVDICLFLGNLEDFHPGHPQIKCNTFNEAKRDTKEVFSMQFYIF